MSIMATRWPAFTDKSCEGASDPIAVDVTMHDSDGEVHLLTVYCATTAEIAPSAERWIEMHGFNLGMSDWKPLS